METELARTFLTVIAAGNFVNAAERLHLTQSTISARVRSLEDMLGVPLFVRNKAGTFLTPAGRQFQKHAATLVRTVERARHEVGTAQGYRAVLTVGGRYGLWDVLLLEWMRLQRASAPDIAINAEVGFEDDLMRGIVDGRIDLGLMYTPQSRPGLKVEYLLGDLLVLVSTETNAPPEPGPGYVFVDWGTEFHAEHSASFPEYAGPAITANLGWLGIEQIMGQGGSGYFPLRMVRRYLQDGRLVMLDQAPKFTLPAYIVYPEERNEEIVDPALDMIRKIAAVEMRKETAYVRDENQERSP